MYSARKIRYDFKLKSFSLIELLIVVAIITILIALLLPTFKLAKEKAQSSSCVNNLRQIHINLLIYLADNAGFYPPYGYTNMPGRFPVVGFNYRWTWLDSLNQTVGLKCPSVTNYGPSPVPQPAFSYCINWNFVASEKIYGQAINENN